MFRLQKLPKVNRNLAEKLMDEKKDKRKEAVEVSSHSLLRSFESYSVLTIQNSAVVLSFKEPASYIRVSSWLLSEFRSE